MRLAAQHADWVLGFVDETWWSRLAQPALHSWTAGKPLRLVEQAAPHGDPDPKALACYGLLRTDGVAQMRQGLAAYRAAGTERQRPYYLALLAEAYGSIGQPAEGLSLLAEALATVDLIGERGWGAELHRLQGELLLVQAGERQQVPEAEACVQQALDVACRQQAKSLELRAAMSLSRLWQRQGKRDEARDLLAPIYNWFTEGFDTADLQEARALLEALT
jgi:predicted ATPase